MFQQFQFEMDSDVIKIVELNHFGRQVRVDVRYCADDIVQLESQTLRISGKPEITAGKYGLVITWHQSLAPWFDWPTIKRRRRF